MFLVNFCFQEMLMQLRYCAGMVLLTGCKCPVAALCHTLMSEPSPFILQREMTEIAGGGRAVMAPVCFEVTWWELCRDGTSSLHSVCVKVIEAFGCWCRFCIVFSVKPPQCFFQDFCLLSMEGLVNTQLNSQSFISQAARGNLTLPLLSLEDKYQVLADRGRGIAPWWFSALC